MRIEQQESSFKKIVFEKQEFLDRLGLQGFDLALVSESHYDDTITLSGNFRNTVSNLSEPVDSGAAGEEEEAPARVEEPAPIRLDSGKRTLRGLWFLGKT